MATDTRKGDRPSTEHHVQRSTTHDAAHAPSPGADAQRRDSNRPSFNPFSIMRQGVDELERWFGHMGSGRGWTPAPGRFMSQMAQQLGDWMPAVEAFQRGNEFVVRAEVPGMTRQDLTIEVGDDALTIRGERKRQHEEDRDGMFWSERTYGSFARVVPLPPGTITDSAKATFNNGMLEVVMQTPSAEARRGRRIDISGT
jgi:HSP20 family protein